MKKKQDTLGSNGPSNTSQTNNSGFSSEPVKNTPFHVMGDDKGYVVVMGQHAITPLQPTKEQAIAYMDNNPYETIITITLAVIEQYQQLTKTII